MFFNDMCSCAFICLVLFFHRMGSHPCHFYVEGFSSLKGRDRENGLQKAMCYSTLATSTLIITIVRTCHGTIVMVFHGVPHFEGLLTRCYIKLHVNLDEMMPNILPLAIGIHKNL
jgi:hypothetical protein